MSNIKKKQHYVWRAYLRAWASSEQVWTFLKDQNKAVKSSLMGVAQERYFYKLPDFNDHERESLRRLLERTCRPQVKELCMDFFRAAILIQETKKSLSQIQMDNPSSKKALDEKIREFEINTMEDTHSMFEKQGSKLIRVRGLNDLKSLDSNENLFEAIIFLCIQYFRTSSMKKASLSAFDPSEKALAEKYWSMMSFAMALNIAQSVSLDNRLRFRLYESPDDCCFITGDQPVFNLLKDDRDDAGNVKSLELFYPLSPTHALSIHFESQEERYIHQVLSPQQVDFFNDKVFENSSLYVFADSESSLARFIV